jgi:prepilin peptidase CpaA
VGEAVQTIVVAVAIGILLTIAYGDVRTRRIPNALTAAIAVLGLVRLLLAGDLAAATQTLLASASVFAAAFLLFWRGVLGGGDAKLVAATALLVGARDLFDFLLIMSACGGGIALTLLAYDGFRLRRQNTSRKSVGSALPHPPGSDPPRALSTVPYAVAIAGAGVAMLLLKPVL